jgi:hypothetical protein
MPHTLSRYESNTEQNRRSIEYQISELVISTTKSHSCRGTSRVTILFLQSSNPLQERKGEEFLWEEQLSSAGAAP